MTNNFDDYFDAGYDEVCGQNHIINRTKLLNKEYFGHEQTIFQRLQKKVPDARVRAPKPNPVNELFDSFLDSPNFEELRKKFFEKMLESPEGIELFDRKLDEKFKETMINVPQITGESTAVVIIEEISRNEAKDRIITYFNENKNNIYPSDISEKLHIDYDLVWEIINELEEEGFIKTGE